MLKGVSSTLILLFLFSQILFCQEKLNPESLLQRKSTMPDSTLKQTYKKIHSYYYSTAPDSALFYANQGLEEAMRRDNQKFIVDMQMRLGASYLEIGDHTNAQIQLTDALKISEETKYASAIPVICANMGIIFATSKDFDTALEYYNKAMHTDSLLGNWTRIGITLSNMSLVLLERGFTEKAKKNYFTALEIYKKEGAKDLISSVLNNLGEVYLSQGDSDSSLIYLHGSMNLKEMLGQTRGFPGCMIALGKVYLQTEKYDSAFYYYNKAYQISDSLDMFIEGHEAALGLSDYYGAIGENGKALGYHRIYDKLKDKLYNSQRTEQINELEIRYQVEKKNGEIELLSSKVLLQKRLRNLGIIVIILSAALFLVTYKRIKLKSQLLEKESELSKERTKQLKFEVAEKNRELMSHSMLSIQKGQILNDLKYKLLTIKDGDKRIDQAIKLVEENHSADSEWENLKIHFEGVHPGFFTQLQDACPELTSTDLRHCAYIKIQMSTKDVARIMNVDPKSVKMTRYRLKKKLSLSEEESLENYLTNLL